MTLLLCRAGGVVNLHGNRLELHGTSRFFSNGRVVTNFITMGRVFQVCDATEFDGRDQAKVTTVTATGAVHLTDSQLLNARGVIVSGQMTVDSLDIVDGWESLELSGASSSLSFSPASLFNIDTTVIEGTMTSSEAMAEGTV